MTRPTYIFDIDGTLADNMHRIHLISKDAHERAQTGSDPGTYLAWEGPDWDAFHATCHLDKPIEPMITVCRAILRNGAHDTVFVTGRMERCREVTIHWLRKHIGKAVSAGCYGRSLYMRAEGDTRPDYVIKEEILDYMIASGHRPVMAFDDRPQVLEMWKRRGILVAAVGMKEPF